MVGPEGETGFLPFPGQPGELVFGLHGVGIEGNKLGTSDSWMNALHAEDCTDPVEVEAKARAILDTMSGEEDLTLVRSPSVDQRPLKVPNRYLLEDFELAEPSAD